jgi:hypothetical protein
MRAGNTLLVAGFLFLAVSLPRVLPGYLTPHFTLREVSQELGTIIGPDEFVATTFAEGLFNDNTLHYSLRNLAEMRDLPPFFASVPGVNFNLGIDDTFLAKHYELVRTFEIYVSPEFYALNRRYRPSSTLGEQVRLYRRRSGT